ncbi:hypothetical protein BBD42_29665 [Paenibacillus sp. BIHB 4019]|uniref:Butirosin biosynthesis protein H N-terminal domain-containing protein n=1 Tax=Paenibacillus sp. BIHB 4019 TaxID=1870819 RepID=A0A1B2DR87_9BACL|nr:hypothetical protein [Paenibacillus sp. BIHB 4019]ANY70210.1 hypothetical protein BBD42_29665 [Paenibacillus sp. BIHB 4019]
MNLAWVDCSIDKLLALYPGIHPYAAMIDRWAFKPVWDGEAEEVDLSRVLATEEQLLIHYGIERSYENNWIDEALRSGHLVLLPCDLFYMPHAKVFYGKEHAGHYIVVRELLPDGSYLIFDDHPAFCGVMERAALKTAHDALGLPYQRFVPGMLQVTEASAIGYVSRMLKADSFYLGDFARRLLASKETVLRKCMILKGTRHFHHRLYGFIRMVDAAPLPLGEGEAVSELRQSIVQYIDDWRVTVNLATRVLLQPALPIWDRVENRLENHQESEALLPNAADRFLELLHAAETKG